jgi:AcrR family transcriptional regulator
VSVKDRRQELIDQAIEYVEQNGFADMSLRALAAGIGTSHRMLIHHFGSKEGLWVAIVQAVEARQRQVLGAVLPDASRPAGEAMRAWWKHISDPALWSNARLFYELYGRAFHDRVLAEKFLDGIVESWLAPATAINLALGVPPDLARAHARAGIAMTRGLLLDLLATEDVDGVDAAMEAFIAVYEGWFSALAAAHAGQKSGTGSTSA